MNLYAWKNSTYNTIFWTDTLNPNVSSRIYDSNGNDVTNTYIGYNSSTDAHASVSAASSSSITYYVYWSSPMKTYTTSIPIGYNYSGGADPK